MTSSDALSTLSAEFWAGHLAAEPTEAHLLGHYPTTGRFEDASRAAEDAEIARLRDVATRAEAIDSVDLDDQERITRAVLVSLGANGTLLVDGKRSRAMAAPKVEVVDTVGAGDTFCGYLAAGLESGLPLKTALARAAAAGSLACLKPGAQPAIPLAAEVEAALSPAGA